MRLSFSAVLVLVLAGSLCVSAFAADPYDRPSKGNLLVSKTAKYLYVVWSVPKDLGPLARFVGKDAPGKDPLEAFVARTAVFLCKEHASVEPDRSKPCKVQLVRMNTNDEYTKSAAVGFKTAGVLVLPLERATEETLQKALTLSLSDLKALFVRFEIQHERLEAASGP